MRLCYVGGIYCQNLPQGGVYLVGIVPGIGGIGDRSELIHNGYCPLDLCSFLSLLRDSGCRASLPPLHKARKVSDWADCTSPKN